METSPPQLLPPATEILQRLRESNFLAFPFLPSLAICKHKPLLNTRQGERSRRRMVGRKSLALINPCPNSSSPWTGTEVKVLGRGHVALLWSSSKVQHFWGRGSHMGRIVNPTLPGPSLLWAPAAFQVTFDFLALFPGSPAGPAQSLNLTLSPGVASENLWCVEAWSNVRENATGTKTTKGQTKYLLS